MRVVEIIIFVLSACAMSSTQSCHGIATCKECVLKKCTYTVTSQDEYLCVNKSDLKKFAIKWTYSSIRRCTVLEARRATPVTTVKYYDAQAEVHAATRVTSTWENAPIIDHSYLNPAILNDIHVTTEGSVMADDENITSSTSILREYETTTTTNQSVGDIGVSNDVEGFGWNGADGPVHSENPIPSNTSVMKQVTDGRFQPSTTESDLYVIVDNTKLVRALCRTVQLMGIWTRRHASNATMIQWNRGNPYRFQRKLCTRLFIEKSCNGDKC